MGRHRLAKTIGMVALAAFAASAGSLATNIKMTATLRRGRRPEPRYSIVLTLSPTIVEGDVLTLDEACFVETLADERNERRVDSGRTAVEQSNHRNRTLLRARRERP